METSYYGEWTGRDDNFVPPVFLVPKSEKGGKCMRRTPTTLADTGAGGEPKATGAGNRGKDAL